MKFIKNGLLLSALIAVPSLSYSQINDYPGSTFGTIGQDFTVENFVRVNRDFTNASISYDGSYSHVDEVVSIGSRIKPYDDDLTIMNILNDWKLMGQEEFLRHVQAETEEFTGPEDCDEALGLADFFRDVLDEIGEFYGRPTTVEWGAVIVTNNGDLSFHRNGLYTDGDSEEVSHNIPNPATNVVSIIHNHPRQGSANDGINLQNRYPSDIDWDRADDVVALGADPDVLTLTMVDTEGNARVFAYADRNQYRNLSDSQMENGVNLPEEIPDDADFGECVTI